MMEKVKSVHDFNWAWQFWDQMQLQWVQFDCTECLMLEFNYQAFKISGLTLYKCGDIKQG